MSVFDPWLEDPSVEDILMQRPDEVFIQRGGRTTCHEIRFDFEMQKGLSYLAASLKGQNVGKSLPLLSADLPGGLRLQSVLPPCVQDNTVALAIRRAKDFAPTLSALGEGGIFAATQPLRTGLSREDEALVALYREASRATDPDTRRNTWEAFFRATVKASKTHVLCGKVGSGKAQPDETPVLTPTGFRQIKDLSPGDLITAPDGKTARVVGVFPQGKKPIYRVTFSDGRSTECCDDHLWKVWYLSDDLRRGKPTEKWRVAPLSKIRQWLNGREKTAKLLAVPLVESCAINLPPQDLPMHPYALGALLGDGCFRQRSTVSISSIDQHILDRVVENIPEHKLVKLSEEGCDYALRQKVCQRPAPLIVVLKELGLHGLFSHEKFVPDIYKSGSAEQRLALLQGLLDTDGSVGYGTHASFSSTSYKLALDVQELAWSLGAIAKVSKRQTYFKGTDGNRRAGKVSWRVSIVHPDITAFFSVPRKVAQCTPKTMKHRLKIVAVDLVGEKPARCISVDHPDHLYVTNDYIVTHNTYASMALAQEIPLDDRVCTIQDANEWGALPHRNRADLFYSKGDQGSSKVTPNDLVEAALRMAMKWLFLQELRGAEAFSFLRARRSGHPGLTTCHADSTRDAFPTLALMVRQHPAASSVELPLIEASLREVIDVVIHFHRPGGRFEISEVWFGPAEREMRGAA
jgi:type IV secretory pathway ATPase VirB11/archaellum biosynthesis ATPase